MYPSSETRRVATLYLRAGSGTYRNGPRSAPLRGFVHRLLFYIREREREPADSAKARFATTRGDLAIAQPRFLLVLPPSRPLHLPPWASAREIVVSRGFTRLIREVNGRALDAKEINFQTYIMSNCSATRRVAKLA